MKKKKSILLAILLMAVGFATITTSLIINGSTLIGTNSNDFQVLFTKAILDGVEDNTLIVDDTHITFDTKELKNVGDKSVLDYTIKNNSRNYDADLVMSFSPETTEYIRVTNTLESNELAALEETTGKLTIELIKGYVGETTLEENISVEIVANAKERDSLAVEQDESLDVEEITFYSPNNEVLQNRSVSIDNTNYTTDNEGKIQPVGLKSNHVYNLKISQLDGLPDLSCNMIFNGLTDCSGYPVYAKHTANSAIGLYNLVKSQSRGSSSNIDFSLNSLLTNTNGVYQLAEDNKVYFYRGEVDNNVIFDGYCWKIMRTTDTYGVKLIYNGLPDSNGACTATGEDTVIAKSPFNYNSSRVMPITVNGALTGMDISFLGYMYGNLFSTTNEDAVRNTSSSAAKIVLENWYRENLTNVSSMIEDTPYCNDRRRAEGEEYSYNGAVTNFAVYDRLLNENTQSHPSLSCTNNDKFTVDSANGNGKLDYSIGLITLDEAVLGGMTTNNSYKWNEEEYKATYGNNFYSNIYNNKNNYLCNGIGYYTMTPSKNTYYYTPYLVELDENGGEAYSSKLPNSSSGIRPVISVNGNLKVLGSGTKQSPYQVIGATSRTDYAYPSTKKYNFGGNLHDKNGELVHGGVIIIYKDEYYTYPVGANGNFNFSDLADAEYLFYYLTSQEYQYLIENYGDTYNDYRINSFASIRGSFSKDRVSLYTGSVSNFTVEESNGVNLLGAEWNYEYTGNQQYFITPAAGNYKIELWGAQGGSENGGTGGYSVGEIELPKDLRLFVNVGGQGTNTTGGYNGGGAGSGGNYFAGGGATHIATSGGLLSTLSGNKNSIIMVAGAGGGGVSPSYPTDGGAGGGYIGNSGGQSGSSLPVLAGGGSQVSGGAKGRGALASGSVGTFGKGGVGSNFSAGGGAGYYGGGSSGVSETVAGSGGGGSGYIASVSLSNKHMTCYNCATSDDESTRTYSNECRESNPVSSCSKYGNGYAKITYLGD